MMPKGDPRDGFVYPTLTLMMLSVSGKFALSGKKKEKNKGKLVPDYFALGAIVWSVQVRLGLSIQIHAGETIKF